MERPGSAKSDHELRGDYAGVGADYVIAQGWNGYTPAMHDRWKRLHARQTVLATRFAAKQFRDGLAQLDCADGIPKFEDANAVLGAATGWQLVAVPGFIPDAVFFAHLAARRFPVTHWLREESELDYLVEPDVFHDFFGHVPMLLDPVIADFLEAYGRAGERAMAMGALDLLARIYWYTIEFGLVEEDGQLKAFGAGIVSSAGELPRSVTDMAVPRLRFDPERIMRTAYRIDSFQDCYFVLDGLEQLVRGLVSLDFGPIYERWREAEPLPAGQLLPGEQAWPKSGRAKEKNA